MLLPLLQNNVLASGVSGGVGSLSSTLDGVTISATGAVDIAATLSRTLGTLTVSAAGTLDISGTASRTLGTLTLSGASTLDITGTLSQSLAALSVVGVSTISGEVQGTLSIALDSLRLDAQGIDPDRRSTGAGSSRRRRRYFVEIDGQDFEVSNPDEAAVLLERAKQVAVAAIEKARAAPVRVNQGIQRPRLNTSSPELKPLVRQAQREFTKLYDDAIRDLEIRALIAQADEEDEEETLIRFLM